MRRQFESARDPVQDVFDHQHALRSAEAAERRLRSLMRLADKPGDLQRRHVICVIHVEHGAPQDGLGKVEAPASVGVQVDARGLHAALAVEARGEACQKRVPLAGDRHIQAARKADPHRTAGLASPQRGYRGEAIGLRFLAAERAAHAQALHRHHMARHAQHPRDNLLRLAGMLRGRVQRDAARFVQPRHGRLRLQVKMLLAADVNLAFDAMRTLRQLRFGIAAPYAERTAVKTPLRDRVFHGENRRQRPVLRDHRQRAEAGGFQRLAQHPRHRLIVKHHLARKDGLIVPYRAGIAFARHIGRGQYPHDAGHPQRRGSVQVRQLGMCVRRQHRPGVQQPRKPRQQIVRVQRLSRDMPASAFVRQWLAGPLHAASACRVWW